MPERLTRSVGTGFISLWEIEEPVDFFERAVDPAVLVNLNELHTEYRLLQKLVPHYLLSLHHEHVQINNLERKPTATKGFISISHCKKTLALFYHPEKPVGIDIEHEHPKVLRIRKKFLNPQELDFCGDDIVRCLVIWAVKESVFKKYGNETAFFAENISVNPFDPSGSFELSAQVRVNRALIIEKLRCELIHGLVMAYTL